MERRKQMKVTFLEVQMIETGEIKVMSKTTAVSLLRSGKAKLVSKTITSKQTTFNPNKGTIKMKTTITKATESETIVVEMEPNIPFGSRSL